MIFLIIYLFFYQPSQPFVVWVMSDPHIVNGSKTLVNSFQQADSPDGFEWDVALILGDFSGGAWPTEAECAEVQSQLPERRGRVYTLAGNHDADDGMAWFQTCLNPIGQTGRAWPVTGEFDHYYFDVGNLRFLMMSDRNDGPREFGGRGGPDEPRRGGYPAGKITAQQWSWFQGQVIDNDNKILIAAHHHMLRNTTTGSEPWGGAYWNYHGVFEYPECSSYLCFVGNERGEMVVPKFLSDHPIALWLGGHTHLRDPLDTTVDYRGVERGPVERGYGGTWFVNVAALTDTYGTAGPSMSKVLEFRECSDIVTIRTFIHSQKNWDGDVGFYEPATVEIKLPYQFMRSAGCWWMWLPGVWK